MKVDVTVAGIAARLSDARREKLRQEAISAALAELSARAAQGVGSPPASAQSAPIEPDAEQQR